MKRFFVKILSSCGFLGYIPVASGTFGTVAGVAMVWLVYLLLGVCGWSVTDWQWRIVYVCITIFLVWVSVPISTAAEVLYREKDSSKIVIDEAVSFFITMFLLPFSLKIVVVGFLLNRVFDIIKPQPARYCQDRMSAGLGVMMDDVVSAVYSNVVLRIIILLTGNFFFS